MSYEKKMYLTVLITIVIECGTYLCYSYGILSKFFGLLSLLIVVILALVLIIYFLKKEKEESKNFEMKFFKDDNTYKAYQKWLKTGEI